MAALDDVLAEEMDARRQLTALLSLRSTIDRQCGDALERLNRLKRDAYHLGFRGNIMRDAEGNRVNFLAQGAAK